MTLGVGLSTVVGNETGLVASSAWAAAENLYNVLFGASGFFNLYPNFRYHDFYIMGESYGGHYVPAISSYILKHKPSWLKFKGVGGYHYDYSFYIILDGLILLCNPKHMLLMHIQLELLILGE